MITNYNYIHTSALLELENIYYHNSTVDLLMVRHRKTQKIIDVTFVKCALTVTMRKCQKKKGDRKIIMAANIKTDK